MAAKIYNKKWSHSLKNYLRIRRNSQICHFMGSVSAIHENLNCIKYDTMSQKGFSSHFVVGIFGYCIQKNLFT